MYFYLLFLIFIFEHLHPHFFLFDILQMSIFMRMLRWYKYLIHQYLLYSQRERKNRICINLTRQMTFDCYQTVKKRAFFTFPVTNRFRRNMQDEHILSGVHIYQWWHARDNKFLFATRTMDAHRDNSVRIIHTNIYDNCINYIIIILLEFTGINL